MLAQNILRACRFDVIKYDYFCIDITKMFLLFLWIILIFFKEPTASICRFYH